MGLQNKKFTTGQHSAKFFKKYQEITGLSLKQVKPGALVWHENGWWYRDENGDFQEVGGTLPDPIDGGSY